MSTPILATKLYRPPTRPQLVSRSRLIARLNQGLHCRLSLISAPAGFGKTTLVSEWISNTKQPAAWLSLDARDNDLNQFLTYFIAAIRTIHPDFGAEALAVLQSPPPVPTESLLTSLLNEIAVVPEKFILVLDDYHLIDNPQVDDSLAFMLDYFPPQIHLVLITREDPQLPLARNRARGQLTELRASDLRFTAEEATSFLNKVMQLNLSPVDIEALEARTEGWIAGLQLSALAIQGYTANQGNDDPTSFIQAFSGSHHYVLDYLVEEVLQQQPAHVQTFLTHTACLEQLSAPLCEALLVDADDSGQETLAYLERANLLLIPLDNERTWYRYHHLFADVLQARLTQENPEVVRQLHQRASHWYEQNEMRDEAIQHALASEDYQRAAELIELIWSDIRRSCFRSPTWLGWVQSLPEDMVQLRPVLCVGYAWELLNFGEMEAAVSQIEDAEHWLEPDADWLDPMDKPVTQMVVTNEAEFAELRGVLANARAYHAQAYGDFGQAIQHAQRALSFIPEQDYYNRGITASLLCLANMTIGELDLAYEFMSESTRDLKRAGNEMFMLSGIGIRADIRVAQGRLHEAIQLYERTFRLLQFDEEILMQGMSSLYLGASDVYRELGEMEGADNYLRQAMAMGEASALPDWNYRLRLSQARNKQSDGEFDAALQLLDEAERHYFRVATPTFAPIPATRARIWIKQGQLQAASTWVNEQGLSLDDELTMMREYEHLTLARLHIAQYQQQRDDAILKDLQPFLLRLYRAAEAGGRKGVMIELSLLLALFCQELGDKVDAQSFMQRAINTAVSSGHIRLFVDEGPAVVPLLALITGKTQEEKNFVEKLKTAVSQQHQTEIPKPSQSPLPEPLTPREEEVLHLIVAGHSNPEIAKELVIAVTTVKTHVKNIYEKMHVINRAQAVARAKELNLV